jgi:hypothetical protein
MSWKLKRITIAHEKKKRGETEVSWWVDEATNQRPVVGDCFYAPHMLEDPYRNDLSPQYWREHAAKRPPIVVVLPGKTWWCVDQVATSDRVGWQVTGSIDTDPITLTCSPSINYMQVYHGFVQNGVITDDVEGRHFNALGERQP